MKALQRFFPLAVFNKESAPVVNSALVGELHQKLLQTLPQNRWVQRRLAFSGTALSEANRGHPQTLFSS